MIRDGAHAAFDEELDDLHMTPSAGPVKG